MIAALIVGLIYELGLGLIAGLLFGLLSLLKKDEAIQSIQPNQGIWNSVRNMVLAELFFGLNSGLSSGLLFGWRLGLLVGLIALMHYGGAACIQHIMLRSLLTFYNYTPLNYVRFLDYCADRIFLRKVGGYIFIHRLLMEHFAAMTDGDIERIANSTNG